MELDRQDLGKVTLTMNSKFNPTIDYEELCCVYVESGSTIKSYISKQPVPAGTSINNTDYWQPIAYTKDGGGSIEPVNQDVVLINAVGRELEARNDAYAAYKDGKAIVLKVASDKFILATVISEYGNSVDLRGFDLNYKGYVGEANTRLITTVYILNSAGLSSMEVEIPTKSCRTFDFYGDNQINNIISALDSYSKGLSIIGKIDANTFIPITKVTNDTLIGHTFEIASIDNVSAIKETVWSFNRFGVSTAVNILKVTSNGGGGDQPGAVDLIRKYSTKIVDEGIIPDNPDNDSAFWNQTNQTDSSIWAAMKTTGTTWTVWKIAPKDGKDGTNGKDGAPGKDGTNGKDGHDGAAGKDGISPNTSFKSIVFIRTNSTPETPIGGSYSNPVPDGWSDGVPNGDEQIWMSTRIFSSDGKDPQQAEWTKPAMASDNAYMDYEFSSVDNPGIPSKLTPVSPETNLNWSNEADETTIWMAMREVANGDYAPNSAWKILKIKGEKGEDGTSLNVKGSLNDVSQLPSSGNTVGDAYLIGGDLYVWDGDSWENAGKIQGPAGAPGTNGKTPYIHIKYSNDGGLTFTSNNGEDPGNYIGMYVDYESTDSSNPNSYKPWKYWRGEDGFGYEYIFKLTSNYNAPTVPAQTSQVDDFVPDGWTDNPGSVNVNYPYCWVCYRKKTDGSWGKFIGSSADPTKAALFASYGQSGENAINLELDNDIDSIALTYEGLVEYEQTIETDIGMFDGNKQATITNIEVEAPDGIIVTTALTGSGTENFPAYVHLLFPKDLSGINSGGNNITIKVTGYCANNPNIEHTLTKIFTIIGVKAAKPGESAIIYKLQTNVPTFKKYGNGEYSEAAVYIETAYKKIGLGDWIALTNSETNIKYYVSIDNGEQTLVQIGTKILTNAIKQYVDFSMYVDDKLADGPERVNMIEEFIGEDAEIVNEQNYYAALNSFVNPSNIEIWSDTPFAVEPGQYLYIKTVRTWNNGKTTYSYSWTRSGLNGYSNLPFRSSVFMRINSAPNTPVGGSFNSPIPTTEGWSDGIPSGSGALWMSWRIFTADGAAPQESSWNQPISAISSVSRNIKYSSSIEAPKDPDNAISGVWYDTPSENSIWQAIQSISGNVPGAWEVYKIKGEGITIDATTAVTPFVGEWNENTKYYGTKTRTDIVRVTGVAGSEQEETYYYIANKTKNFDGTLTPKPGTLDGADYWLKFSKNFDNVATGFIFSEKIQTDILTAVNAKIENLEVEKIGSKVINAINISSKKAIFNDVIIIGSQKNPFTAVTDSFNFDYNDNVSMYSSGSFLSSYTVPCGLEQSGRTIKIVNFLWNQNSSSGACVLNVVSGCCFLENGIRKKNLTLSKEIVELVGYGDENRFYGWIVISRQNLMTTKSYGNPLRILAQGTIRTGTSPKLNSGEYYTCDGTSLSITRKSKGTYIVKLPSTWGLEADKYIVLVTTCGRTSSDNVIVSSITDKTATQFTLDCESVQANYIDEDGRVQFLIANVSDWLYVKDEVDSSYLHTNPAGITTLNREAMSVILNGQDTSFDNGITREVKLISTSGSIVAVSISNDYKNGTFTLNSSGYDNVLLALKYNGVTKFNVLVYDNEAYATIGYISYSQLNKLANNFKKLKDISELIVSSN